MINKGQIEHTIVIMIWGMVIVVALASLYIAPIANFIVILFPNKEFFVVSIAVPIILVFLNMTWRLFLALLAGKDMEYSPTKYLIALIFYCLIFVVSTGGIYNSTLTSLIAIVPLLSGPFIASKKRLKIFAFFALGVGCVGVFSQMGFFNPPLSYPNPNWNNCGIWNESVVMVIILLSIMVEIGIIKMISTVKVQI